MRARWTRSLSAEGLDSYRTRALYALFLGAMFDSELAKIMARYNRATVARFAESLREAIDRGEIRADVDVEAEATARSGERCVGKGCIWPWRYGWSACHLKNK